MSNETSRPRSIAILSPGDMGHGIGAALGNMSEEEASYFEESFHPNLLDEAHARLRWQSRAASVLCRR